MDPNCENLTNTTGLGHAKFKPRYLGIPTDIFLCQTGAITPPFCAAPAPDTPFQHV